VWRRLKEELGRVECAGNWEWWLSLRRIYAALVVVIASEESGQHSAPDQASLIKNGVKKQSCKAGMFLYYRLADRD